MNNLLKELKDEQHMLCSLLETLKSELIGLPNGNLRISNSHGRKQYYITGLRKDDKYYIGNHISKGKNYDLINDLAKKDYLSRVTKSATKRLKQIDSLIDDFDTTKISNIYSNLNLYRQELVTPVMLSDESYIDAWYKEPKIAPSLDDPNLGIITNRGESVRSKSEKIIADYLYEKGIPYKYECPIRLSNGAIKYPDFLILDIANRKVYILEHLGMMDDMGYVERNIKKTDDYLSSGYVIGKNLLITYETSKKPLNVTVFKALIDSYFN